MGNSRSEVFLALASMTPFQEACHKVVVSKWLSPRPVTTWIQCGTLAACRVWAAPDSLRVAAICQPGSLGEGCFNVPYILRGSCNMLLIILAKCSWPSESFEHAPDAVQDFVQPFRVLLSCLIKKKKKKKKKKKVLSLIPLL